MVDCGDLFIVGSHFGGFLGKAVDGHGNGRNGHSYQLLLRGTMDLASIQWDYGWRLRHGLFLDDPPTKRPEKMM